MNATTPDPVSGVWRQANLLHVQDNRGSVDNSVMTIFLDKNLGIMMDFQLNTLPCGSINDILAWGLICCQIGAWQVIIIVVLGSEGPVVKWNICNPRLNEWTIATNQNNVFCNLM